jgi:hypothetical protein
MYFDLDQPSQYGRWQVKMDVDNTTSEQIAALLRLGPFPVPATKNLTISLKTTDTVLSDCHGIDINGPFPFLYDGTLISTPSNYVETGPGEFAEGTEVIIQCLFTAYNIKGREGFAWKLLQVIKTSNSNALDDGLILDNSPLMTK